MARGVSSLVISLIMLAIVVPIGVVLVERARSTLNIQPGIEIPALLRVYALANGSSWFLVMVNYGDSDSNLASLILSNGSSIDLGFSIPARSVWVMEIPSSSRPLHVVVKGSPGVVSVEVIG